MATGFFITEDGFLITNEPVVRAAAQAVKLDAANDRTLLKVEGRFGWHGATVNFPNVRLPGFALKLAKVLRLIVR